MGWLGPVLSDLLRLIAVALESWAHTARLITNFAAIGGIVVAVVLVFRFF
ncbi:hypothetical protein O4J56_03140 [Nocardiopsis sp. RSe5-2]|uniref:YggT family protein n=1 Tax=Nocardiopsis endophytica TaxID=3018445 RepID=A0ABT4TY58_9ACTN|nr:hypothetical protein [Nocardiopsis endophytica]MDA2809626.1 hypothetical protein [Nocardiopsis endophytica]